MKKANTLVLASMLFLATTTPSRSIQSEREEIVKHASGTLIEQILDAAKIDYSEVKQNVYSFKVRGYKAVIFVKPGDIQLYAVFTGRKITLNRINDWNREHRFSKAYLDNDGDAALESDLDFDGGVTGATIGNFFALFARSIEAFSDHLK